MNHLMTAWNLLESGDYQFMLDRDAALVSCFAVTGVCLGLMFLFPNMSDRTANGLALVCLGFLLYAFGDYAMAYLGKNKKIYDLE